ncbi:uncharacterized protein BDR25DRAFT_336433 [Lindgomyces ingoldianus]|uniref:Uncharacterized protein n=1 Tax=Lindgomyces ingoldianus TaxID=673940 RepID=A0ACB6QI10_9PLEO|nr:uncharacterized protein BDR25DRAFT_336433 [Lindgomyces ingoldianus]KAF2466569.1 hypothetical protein BDR25DRAFT_336433 [Lindgomyces ingoldianus]
MASQLGGALPPPPGVGPNFIDPPSQQRDNLIQHATCLTLISLFLAMRIYTRLYILRAKLGADDYFCVLSYVAESKGIGRHMWDVPAVQVVDAFKYLVLAAWAYLLLTGCIKLTFLFCYRRIFSMESGVKTFINLGISFVVCLTAGLFFATMFSCTPVQRSWNAIVPGTCFNPHILPWLSASSSSLTDIYILVLPIAPLWRLNMSLKSKLKVMVAFSFGLLACIASLVRLGMTRVLQSSLDASWNTASIGKWSAIEVDVGIMCSCLMLFPAFLKHHLPEEARTFVSESLSRISSAFSGISRSQSTAGKGSEKAWPIDKYQSINHGKLKRTNFVVESMHVSGHNGGTTVTSYGDSRYDGKMDRF